LREFPQLVGGVEFFGYLTNHDRRLTIDTWTSPFYVAVNCSMRLTPTL
jgi:hypothetical protein